MTHVKKTFIDGNSVGFAASQAGPRLTAGDQETQGVFMMIKILRSIVARNAGGQFLILWDGLSWRKAESPDYKAQRGATAKDREMRQSYKSQTKFIRRAVRALGISQAAAANLEADDLAAMVTERAVSKGHKVYLVTRDRDWQQLVQPNVSWHCHSTQKRVSHKNFADETGYRDRFQFSEAKALQGDSSDNIAGVGQIGEGRAKILLDTWGTVQAFLDDPNPEVAFGKKLPKAFRDFREMPERQERFKENMRLMDLTHPENLPRPVDLRVDKGEFNIDAFADVCAELGFHSYLNDLENFTKPFKLSGDVHALTS